MGKNTNFVSHKKSKLKNQDGSPQLPSASALVEGEIAINFGKDVETLSIKNESGDVVTFSSDNYYSEKKLGSAFTSANSAVTVTDLIDEVNVSNGVEPTNESVEIWVDTSESPITVDVYTKTEVNSLLTTHTDNTAIHLSGSEKENIDSLSGNVSVLSAITAADIEKWNNGGDLSNYYTKSETSGSSEISTALNDLNGKMVAEIESSNGSITTSTSTRGDGSVKADIQTDASKISGLTAVSDSDEGAAKISGVTSTDSIRKGVENIYKSLASEIAARKAAFLARTISSANKGITVTETPNADGYNTTLTLTLDTSTNGSGKEKLGNDNALTITDNGLFLSSIWTCGEYDN